MIVAHHKRMYQPLGRKGMVSDENEGEKRRKHRAKVRLYSTRLIKSIVMMTANEEIYVAQEKYIPGIGTLHLRSDRGAADEKHGIVITSVAARGKEHIEVDVLQGGGMVGNKILLEDPDLRRKKRLRGALQQMARDAFSNGAAFRTLKAPANLWSSKTPY